MNMQTECMQANGVNACLAFRRWNKTTTTTTEQSTSTTTKMITGRNIMRRKALDKEHVDDDNDRHMIKNMHFACTQHKCLNVPIASMDLVNVCMYISSWADEKKTEILWETKHNNNSISTAPTKKARIRETQKKNKTKRSETCIKHRAQSDRQRRITAARIIIIDASK